MENSVSGQFANPNGLGLLPTKNHMTITKVNGGFILGGYNYPQEVCTTIEEVVSKVQSFFAPQV